jgi:hypothetical protein
VRTHPQQRQQTTATAQGCCVCCLTNPEWGLGQVLADDGGSKITVFFLAGGKRTLDTTIAELDLVSGPAAESPILDLAGQVNWQNAHHNLYVIELNSNIFDRERRFAEANPQWLPDHPCVYVGMTGLTPEERFQKHRRGEKDAWFVQKYGKHLLPELYRHFNPLPYDLAKVMEPELARQLRERGYGVWQN